MTNSVLYICGIDFGSDKTGFGFSYFGKNQQQQQQQSPQPQQQQNYFIIPRSDRIKTNSSILFSINKVGQLIKPIEWGSVANRKYQQAEKISGNLGVELFTDLKGSLLKERLTIKSLRGKEFDLFEVLVGFFKLIRKDCLKMMNKNYQTIVAKSKKKERVKENGKEKEKEKKNKKLTISKIRFVFSIPNNYSYLTIRKLRMVFKQSGFIKNLDDRQHLLFVHESIASSIWVTNQKLKGISHQQNNNDIQNNNKYKTNNHTNNINNNKENLSSMLIISIGARIINCIKVKQIKKIPIDDGLKNRYLSYNKIILQPESIQIENSPQNKLIGVYDCDLKFRRFFERLFKMKKPFNQYFQFSNYITKQWEEIKKKIRPEWRFQNKFEIINIPIEIISKEDLVSIIKEFNQTKNNKNETNFENSIFSQKKLKRSNFMNQKKRQSMNNTISQIKNNEKSKEIEIETETEIETKTEMERKKGKLRVGELNVNKKDKQISTVELYISRKILYSFISNLQEEISNSIGKITNENKEMLVNDTEIVCIGGFSNSNLLRYLMNCQFSFMSKDQKKPTLNFDEYYSNGAVIKGSIIFGLYQDIVTNQKICKTIGFTKLKSISTKTNKNQESNSFKNFSSEQIPEKCFEIIINKNQSYPINKIFKFEIEIDILKFPELIYLISTHQPGFGKHLIYGTESKWNGQLSFEHQMKIFLNLKKGKKTSNTNIPNAHLIKLQFEFSFIGAEMIIKLINLKNNKALPVLVEYNYAGLWNTSVNLDYHLVKKKYKPFLSHELNNYYHNTIKNQLKSNNKHQNGDDNKEKNNGEHKHKKKHKEKNKHKNKTKTKHKNKTKHKKKKHKRNSKRKSSNNDKKGRGVGKDIRDDDFKEKMGGNYNKTKNTSGKTDFLMIEMAMI
ncbi:nnp-1 protein putative nuclear protein 1 nop52 [Anaeramoeba flamelloides]|uniref:Nnp-1 protein putative nuclear protein 1 nop52 n=1 Tax=Anaeramoeba flamelloides TaxID=1746091 RepID=A0AAV7YB79_9EUKA|nr:nnp-1 protein putative nuclear protein 1 nop52 [Anaeramoeba flamelloides]